MGENPLLVCLFFLNVLTHEEKMALFVCSGWGVPFFFMGGNDLTSHENQSESTAVPSCDSTDHGSDFLDE